MTYHVTIAVKDITEPISGPYRILTTLDGRHFSLSDNDIISSVLQTPTPHPDAQLVVFHSSLNGTDSAFVDRMRVWMVTGSEVEYAWNELYTSQEITRIIAQFDAEGNEL